MTIHALLDISNEDATRITPPGVHSGIDITIQNVNASGYIYVGGVDVSPTSYGYRVMPNHAISLELSGKSALYAIASAPNMKAAVLSANLESGS